MTIFEATEELIKKYRSITIEDINTPLLYNTVVRLTRYGNADTCILCKAVEGDCKLCIHGIHAKRLKEATQCACGDRTSYSDIFRAPTKKALIKAVNKRADYLEKLLKKYKPIK